VRNIRARDIKDSPELIGRLAENAVGAALFRLAEQNGGGLFYWRERDLEVDYVFKTGRKVIALEVKSGANVDKTSGMSAFLARNREATGLIIGGLHGPKGTATVKLEDFFSNPEIIL
jgi:hypothetical protein